MEIEFVRRWVEEVVLGLGLCPFAGEPWHAGQVRLAVSEAPSEQLYTKPERVRT